MISFEKALNIILKNTKCLSSENILIADSVGRIIDENIISKIDMPPFHKSAMDGYAVKAADIIKVPVKLKCIGLIQAGNEFKKNIKRGECVKIMTGAPLPDSTDSVVIVENTGQIDDIVEIKKKVNKGRNVCYKGEDLKKGKIVVKKRTCLSASHIAILAAVGRKYIKVIKQPSIAILNTGGEIIPVGKPISKNKIYNSNGPMLSAILKASQFKSDHLGIAKDTVKDLTKAVNKGLKYDVLLISGGVSMGDYDIVPDILWRSGVIKKFHEVKIKPGKPLFFGMKKSISVIGIPGNPVSNFIAYYLFISPMIRKMSGHKDFKPRFQTGILENDYKQKIGRKHFVLVNIRNGNNKYYIKSVKSNGSADIQALAKADGFMVVNENVELLRKNNKVEFITWK